jgi:hypothetical protein
MKVYPVNAVEGATLRSEEKEAYAKMMDACNKYFSYTLDFISPSVVIHGNWDKKIDFNTLILGNCNAARGTFTFYDGINEKASFDFVVDEEIKIIEHLDGNKLIETLKGDKFKLELFNSNSENMKIGYLFVGEVWELPRFKICPSSNLEIRSKGDRTFSGQVTGISTEPLRKFSCSFVRIDNDAKKKFDVYMNAVQFIVPHVIDPYYEAHEEFEPIFGTVTGYSEKSKRDENGFFWDFDMSFLEAK